MFLRKTQQPSNFEENQIHDAYDTSTTDTYSCNYINQLQDNIEEAIEEPKYVNITIGKEFETGRIINNKKEYGVIISCGGLPNKTTKTIDLGFNINSVELTGLNGTAWANGGYYIAIPYSLETDYLRVFIQQSTITITTNADVSPYQNSYLTLTYTKK